MWNRGSSFVIFAFSSIMFFQSVTVFHSDMNDSDSTESVTIAMSIAIPVGLLCAYVSTSLILLRYPTILHKKKKINFKVRLRALLNEN